MCPVIADLPEYAQEQSSGSTKTFSEAPGAYGSRSRSNTTRPASYETTSALASRPSPEGGVAQRHVSGENHPSLPQNSQPVMSSSLYTRPHTKNWTEIRIDSDVNSLKRALIQLKKTLDGTLNEKLSQTVSTGLEFVQEFAVDVTLDPDSANSYLILSDDGKQVSDGDIEQGVPENPKRFDVGLCVLAKEGFSSGRFYYEVQVKGKTGWCLGVIRESIKRKRTITLKPEDGFWTVILRNENQYVACEHPFVFLSLRVKPEKVGVFVDYEEGLVSFYDVGSRSHIYSFTDSHGSRLQCHSPPRMGCEPLFCSSDDEPCWSSSSILGSQVLWRHNFSWICQVGRPLYYRLDAHML
ncbi:unnamed protein product [Leuciscus chuanchicus]